MPHESTKVVKLDLSAGSIDTVLVDGEPHVVFRPAVEAIGLDYSTQLRKLRDRSWASRRDIPTTGADGKTYRMAAVDVRTFLMWLATVNETKVAESVRPTLVAYQRETTTAVNDYWTRGGAINERATDEQLDALQQEIEERRIRRALGLVQLIAAMDDSVDPKWKRSRQLHHYAEAAGEIAEIPAEERALLVDTYLKDRGLSKDERRSVRSSFGRRVSLAYEMQHGEKPKDSIGLVDGRERTVKSYTEADRPMFDKVWGEFYADRYPAQQRLGEAS
nr:phage antirepressor N-terminal domain-containing protein [Streptomyces sp. N502]